MSSPTSLENIFTRYKKEVGNSVISKLEFIKDLNDLLFEMPITKPAEQTEKLYYIDGFYKYTIPADFKETIAIYSESKSIIRYVSYFRFRIEEPATAYTDRVDNGKRFLMVRNPYTNSKSVIVSQCDNLTADGVWANTGDAGTPSIDTNTKDSGSGSIKFNITGTQGILTFTRTNAIDASSFTEHMRQRFFSWLPVSPSSIKIRIGNDSSNYYEQSITAQADGEIFDNNDKNELEFAEEDATETGDVDKTDLVWFQFEFNFSPAVNNDNFRLDKIVLAKPEILEHEYYTKYVGIDKDGNLTEKVTESEETTDEPIIKDYPDFINTIIDGLCASNLVNKAPDRAAKFKADYISKKMGGELIGGIEYLKSRYPLRRASYKRVKTLPPLNSGAIRGRKYV